MPLPLLPIAVLSLAGLGAWKGAKHFRKKGVLTPERKVILETALRVLDDSDKLRQLADAFDKEGLKAEADLLRKRATLRELPPDVKAGRRDAFRKGMASTDAAAVEKLAALFDKEGASAAANELKKHAASLKAADVKPGTKPLDGIPPKAAGDDETPQAQQNPDAPPGDELSE